MRQGGGACERRHDDGEAAFVMLVVSARSRPASPPHARTQHTGTQLDDELAAGSKGRGHAKVSKRLDREWWGWEYGLLVMTMVGLGSWTTTATPSARVRLGS